MEMAIFPNFYYTFRDFYYMFRVFAAIYPVFSNFFVTLFCFILAALRVMCRITGSVGEEEERKLNLWGEGDQCSVKSGLFMTLA